MAVMVFEETVYVNLIDEDALDIPVAEKILDCVLSEQLFNSLLMT
jgi:hypothetical protein